MRAGTSLGEARWHAQAGKEQRIVEEPGELAEHRKGSYGK